MGQRTSSLYDFDPLAGEYDSWYETTEGQRQDRLQKADVLRLIPEPVAGLRLLDAGCGTGHWSRFFASMGFSVHGVDVSEEMIAAARNKAIPGCTFEVADILDLPFKNASFDTVAAMTTLEFICDVGRGLHEMARCVRPGGNLIIGTLDRRAPLNKERIANDQQPYASARMLTSDELLGLLAPLGEVRMVIPGQQEPIRPLLIAEVKL